MMEDLDALPLLVLIQRATLRMMAVSTAPAPVPMKRTGINLEKFREKKNIYCIERDSNPSILAYKQSTNPLHQPCQPTKHSPVSLIYTDSPGNRLQ